MLKRSFEAVYYTLYVGFCTIVGLLLACAMLPKDMGSYIINNFLMSLVIIVFLSYCFSHLLFNRQSLARKWQVILTSFLIIIFGTYLAAAFSFFDFKNQRSLFEMWSNGAFVAIFGYIYIGFPAGIIGTILYLLFRRKFIRD